MLVEGGPRIQARGMMREAPGLARVGANAARPANSGRVGPWPPREADLLVGAQFGAALAGGRASHRVDGRIEGLQQAEQEALEGVRAGAGIVLQREDVAAGAAGLCAAAATGDGTARLGVCR